MQKLLIAYITLFLFISCSSETNPPRTVAEEKGGPQGVVDRTAALTNYVLKDVIRDQGVANLDQKALKLDELIHSSCQEGSAGTSLPSVKQAWGEVMRSFHFLEMLQIGPLDSSENATIRYIFDVPSADTAALIRSQIVTAASLKENYVMTRLQPYLVGLDAMEYTLFEFMKDSETLEDSSEACTYLKYVSTDLVKRTEALVNAWSDYLVAFDSPQGQVDIESYVKVIADALYYFDSGTKSEKILKPMGLHSESGCKELECIEKYIAHPYAPDYVYRSVEQNLLALSFVIDGMSEQSFGFKQYFAMDKEPGKIVPPPFKTDVLRQVWANVPQDAELVSTYTNYLLSDAEDTELNKAINDFREYSRWMKTGFVSNLNTKLPGTVQGDND